MFTASHCRRVIKLIVEATLRKLPFDTMKEENDFVHQQTTFQLVHSACTLNEQQLNFMKSPSLHRKTSKRLE